MLRNGKRFLLPTRNDNRCHNENATTEENQSRKMKSDPITSPAPVKKKQKRDENVFFSPDVGRVVGVKFATPQNETPQNDTPQNATPQNDTPQNATPQNGNIVGEKYETPLVNKALFSVKRGFSTTFQDSPFVIPPSPLMKKLGCGTQVTVYRYKRQRCNGTAATPWAIKKAKVGRTKTPILKRLTAEGEILRQLDHPNIVKFKKLTKTAEGDLCLSMEAFGRGLDDIILKRQETDELELFHCHQMMKVTWSVANALNYIHNSKKLLHGDIKSGNVLVGGDFEEVKLCDFGVSIFLKDDLSGPRHPDAVYIGSEPWLSKEIYKEGKITDKADIFSYGLLIWEMLALDVPHVALIAEGLEDTLGDSFTHTAASDSDDEIPQKYYDAIGTRPPFPEYGYTVRYNTILETFVCCTYEDHTERPNAEKLVESLSSIVSESLSSNSETDQDHYDENT